MSLVVSDQALNTSALQLQFLNPITDTVFIIIMEICSIVLTFESVDDILWCVHSNETSLVVLLYSTI